MRMTGMAVMVVAAAGAWAGAPPAEARHLTICMETALGNLSMENAAKTVASGIFAGINVKIEWRSFADCPAEAIYVSFSSETPVNEHRGALAYARPYEGTHIVVFLDRVRYIAPPYGFPRLLGYVLAHEVTHILEGEVRHSETGIMKAQWGAIEHFKMGRGNLGFAAEDVSLIHKGLDWRVSRSATASGSNPVAEPVAGR
jgi:hypothetical protein